MSVIPVALRAGLFYRLTIKCPCGSVFSYIAECANPLQYAFAWTDDHRDHCPQCGRPAQRLWKLSRPEWSTTNDKQRYAAARR